MKAGYNVLFCDVDEPTRVFLRDSGIANAAHCVILSESLNDLSIPDLKKLSNAEIISTFVYSRLSKEVLENFRNLKLICTRSTGYNNVDLDYCKSYGIKVSNVAGYGEITVAEYAMGLVLSITKNIGFSNEKLRRAVIDVNEDIGIDLCGKTVGVVGTGAIGRHFIKLCNGFGCKVLAYDPFQNQDLLTNKMCKYVDLNFLFQNSDIVSLHCPSTKENYHLINKDTISTMKDGVYIVNTARGELIDSVVLYESIVAKKVKGAALDVVDCEDVVIKNDLNIAENGDKRFVLSALANEKLARLPNVIITPHIAFNSYDAILRILNDSTRTIFDFIDGKPITSVI